MKRKPGRKQCRKIGYPTREAARAALRALRETGVVRYYQCPYCRDTWHLTSERR